MNAMCYLSDEYSCEKDGCDKRMIDGKQPCFEKEYTIKEFAELRGVSQQAIYKQLSGKLFPFVVVRGGQKYISGEFFRQETLTAEQSTNSTNDSTKLNNHSTEVEQPVERDENAENYREILDILREQLREKDNQISTLHKQVEQLFNQLETKDEMNNKLIALLENTQKIEAGRQALEAQSLVAANPVAVEAVSENTVEADPDADTRTEGKRGIFSRLFGRK